MKMINQFAYYKPTCELIDTLWNVNLICAIRGEAIAVRINRYIMECKCSRVCF